MSLFVCRVFSTIPPASSLPPSDLGPLWEGLRAFLWAASTAGAGGA